MDVRRKQILLENLRAGQLFNPSVFIAPPFATPPTNLTSSTAKPTSSSYSSFASGVASDQKPLSSSSSSSASIGGSSIAMDEEKKITKDEEKKIAATTAHRNLMQMASSIQVRIVIDLIIYHLSIYLYISSFDNQSNNKSI